MRLPFEKAFGHHCEGLVTNVVASHEQTLNLIQDRRVDHVLFTGSVKGGRQVYQAAASGCATRAVIFFNRRC